MQKPLTLVQMVQQEAPRLLFEVQSAPLWQALLHPLTLLATHRGQRGSWQTDVGFLELYAQQAPAR